MCERERNGQTSETRGDDRQNKSPDAEICKKETVPPTKPKEEADWFVSQLGLQPGMLIPAPLLQAAGEAVARPAIGSDLALTPEGALRGQVVSAQGRGLPGVCVPTAGNAGIAIVSGRAGRSPSIRIPPQTV